MMRYIAGGLLMFSAAAFAEPSSQALELGKELAKQGFLHTLLPMMSAKETDEMLAEIPDITDAEKSQFRTTASEVASAGSERLMMAQANVYAEKLSIPEIEAMIAFNKSEAAKNYRALQKDVIATTVEALDGFDFKAQTRAAFCKKTGKGCEVKE